MDKQETAIALQKEYSEVYQESIQLKYCQNDYAIPLHTCQFSHSAQKLRFKELLESYAKLEPAITLQFIKQDVSGIPSIFPSSIKFS